MGLTLCESIMLHQDELLGDTLRNRPLIVVYRWWICSCSRRDAAIGL